MMSGDTGKEPLRLECGLGLGRFGGAGVDGSNLESSNRLKHMGVYGDWHREIVYHWTHAVLKDNVKIARRRCVLRHVHP